MKQYIGYIRVSTMKQGEHGSSLHEQRAAIEAHARRHGLTIVDWVEERETAAKRGRTGFATVLGMLRGGLAQGLIVHKIDRSARNLRDWADLGELIDLGADVHFANESIDLRSRGGRLSADIQAVVSADYVRNLRDEVIKGLYGRLRQGIYPFAAPVGYRNTGAGKAKTIDPVSGPLVKELFALYGSGAFTMRALVREMAERGLRNTTGKRLNINMISRILNNPFYTGLIHIKRTNQRFEGKHEPLVSLATFDRVQERLAGKVRFRGIKYLVPYRQAFHCAACDRVLIPERQKGHTYYRCHRPDCRGTSVREESLSAALVEAVASLRLTPSELTLLEAHVRARECSSGEDHANATRAVTLQLAQVTDRERRTTDAYIDRLIDQGDFNARRTELLKEKAALRERVASLEADAGSLARAIREKLELIKTASLQRDSEKPAELLRVVQRMCSNLRVNRKDVVVDWLPGFRVIANRLWEPSGPPHRDTDRTDGIHQMAHAFIESCLQTTRLQESTSGEHDTFVIRSPAVKGGQQPPPHTDASG